jgi:hypothetical protein
VISCLINILHLLNSPSSVMSQAASNGAVAKSEDGLSPQDIESQRVFFHQLDTSVVRLGAVGYVTILFDKEGDGLTLELLEDCDLKAQLLNGRIFKKHEVDSIRCILLTQDRRALTKSMLNKIKNLKQDREYEEELGFVDPLVTQVSQLLNRANETRQKMGPKFDQLFALTFAITKYTHWMYDEEFCSFDSKF